MGRQFCITVPIFPSFCGMNTSQDFHFFGKYRGLSVDVMMLVRATTAFLVECVKTLLFISTHPECCSLDISLAGLWPSLEWYVQSLGGCVAFAVSWLEIRRFPCRHCYRRAVGVAYIVSPGYTHTLCFYLPLSSAMEECTACGDSRMFAQFLQIKVNFEPVNTSSKYWQLVYLLNP